MKTTDRDHAASVVLKYLLHLLAIALFYGTLVYTAPYFWMGFLIRKFAKHVLYLPSGDGDKMLFLLVLIYALFCYAANNYLLKLFDTKKVKQLVISVLVDYLMLPLAILLMILYNNQTLKVPEMDVSVLYNIYLINGLLIIKNIIAYQLVSRNSAPAQKAGQRA